MRWLLSIGLVCSVIFASEPPDSIIAEKSPSKALLYSVIPGGGQVYNGKYLKAVLIFAAEVYVLYQFLYNRSIYKEWDPEKTYPLPQHRYREKRNKYAWWAGFVYVYSLLDALVDSHLSTFSQIDPELQVEEE